MHILWLAVILSYGVKADNTFDREYILKEAAPYLVSIEKNYEHECSGAIIGTTWVLTTCECMGGRFPEGIITIQYGVSEIYSQVNRQHSTRFVIAINTVKRGGSVLEVDMPFLYNRFSNEVKVVLAGATIPPTGMLVEWLKINDRYYLVQTALNLTSFDCGIYKPQKSEFCGGGDKQMDGLVDYGAPVISNNELIGLVGKNSFENSSCYIFKRVSYMRQYITNITGIQFE